jgi:hypothetical protein
VCALDLAYTKAFLIYIVCILRLDVILLLKRAVELKILLKCIVIKDCGSSCSIKAISNNALDFGILSK